VRTIRKFRIGSSLRIESRIGSSIRNRIESRSFAGPYSDRPDAETSHCQNLQQVRTGGLHAVHPVKVSANYATRPSVGPLPARLPGTTRAKRGKEVIRRRVFCIHPSVVHPSPATGPASAESITTRWSCSVSCLASYSTPYNLQTSSWKGCTKECKCKKANLECTQLCEWMWRGVLSELNSELASNHIQNNSVYF